MLIMRIANNEKLVYPELSYKINGILFATQNEKQYGDTVERLVKENNIKHEREKESSKFFDDEQRRRNVADFLIEDKILLELKAKSITGKREF